MILETRRAFYRAGFSFLSGAAGGISTGDTVKF